jgi:hypothetical protein
MALWDKQCPSIDPFLQNRANVSGNNRDSLKLATPYEFLTQSMPIPMRGYTSLLLKSRDKKTNAEILSLKTVETYFNLIYNQNSS